jgi:ankyrin repeat protein
MLFRHLKTKWLLLRSLEFLNVFFHPRNINVTERSLFIVQKMTHREINICKERSGSMESNAYYVTAYCIDSKTTSEEYENIHKDKDFTQRSGGRCGWNVLGSSAYHGNAKLAGYLADKDPSVINLGNEFGWTPLFCASRCSDHDAAVEVALELIKRGADVNMATYSSSGDSDKGTTVAGATPLWGAEKEGNEKLKELLIAHGGIIYSKEERMNFLF